MRKANYMTNPIKLCTIPEACERYRLGKNKMRELAEDNKAIRKFGDAVRVDIEIMDKAILNY